MEIEKRIEAYIKTLKFPILNKQIFNEKTIKKIECKGNHVQIDLQLGFYADNIITEFKNILVDGIKDFTKNEININNKSFKLIKNGTHPNFHLIDLINDKKNIEVSQIRKMINYSNKSSFNNLPRIIIIDNLENLNTNSNNALLKIVEEPNENICFLLIHNNNKKILDTLKSRCLAYRINLTFDDSIYITNKLINENILNLLNIDLINYYNTPGDFVNLIKFSQLHNLDLKEFNLGNFLSLLINEKYYKKDDFMKSYIFNFIEIYFLKIFRQSIDKNNIINFYSKFIRKINDTNKFNLDQDSLFMELKSKILNG